MKAFVTGGTGFVGSHLVEALLAAGHEVTCLVRDPAKAARVFPERRPGVLSGDLEDAGALARGTAAADVVFHVAALTAARSRRDFFAINERATQRLVEAAERNPRLTRFVLVSSLAAAGPSERGRPRTPEQPPAPVTHYGASKLAAELAVRSSSIPWTIVRPPTVYGPRDREALRLFQFAARGVVPVFGDGTQELSLVYAVDLARALVRVLDAPAGRVYHAAHPRIVTSAELVRAIHRVVRPDAENPGRVVRIPGFVARTVLWATGTAARLANRSTLLSPDKANEFLASAWTCATGALERDTSWRAEMPLERGLDETAAWYRAHGWL